MLFPLFSPSSRAEDPEERDPSAIPLLRNYTLEVTGTTDLNQYHSFKDTLRNQLPKYSSLYEAELTRNRALLRLNTPLTSPQVSDTLSGVRTDGYTVTVTDVSPTEFKVLLK